MLTERAESYTEGHYSREIMGVKKQRALRVSTHQEDKFCIFPLTLWCLGPWALLESHSYPLKPLPSSERHRFVDGALKGTRASLALVRDKNKKFVVSSPNWVSYAFWDFRALVTNQTCFVPFTQSSGFFPQWVHLLRVGPGDERNFWACDQVRSLKCLHIFLFFVFSVFSYI